MVLYFMMLERSVLSDIKGLGSIVKMRENGAKVVTSMLDVQLKII